ncbi:MAG: GEVED domain-containing protein [Bacteroidota bacterium]
MKKLYTNVLGKAIATLIVMVVFILTHLEVQAQITIGTGTSTSSTAPIDRYFNYSCSELLYLGSEIATTGNITTLAFYKGSGTSNLSVAGVTIYMKMTAATSVTSPANSSGYTQVWTGSFPNSGTSGWQTITLTTPFNYSSTSQNLAILVVKGYEAYSSSRPYYSYTTTTGNKCSYYVGDSSPWASGSTSMTTTTSRPNLQITIQASSPCSGTPTPGNTISTANPVCSGVSFTLSLQNATSGSGLTYQWQSSTDNSTWTNISGATSTTLTTSQTVATYYHCIVSCSGNPGTSNALQVTINPPSSCYCIPSGSSASYYISSFSTTGGITNITNTSSGYSTGGYGNFTAMSVSQVQNSVVNFSVTETGGTQGFAIWVDWNQNGTFETSERVYVTSGYGSSASGSFTVPITAVVGNTRMRVQGNYSNSAPSDPCATNISGEHEDYTFTVIATGSCSGTPTAGTAGSTPQSICSGATAIMSVSGYSAGLTGIIFQWQQSSDGSTNWLPVSGGSGATTTSFTTAALSSTTFYRCAVTCTNSSLTAYTNNVEVDVTTPSISSTTPGSRCGAGSVTLGAIGTGTLNRYAAASGGTTLGTGTTFNTPSISSNTTYYVGASSGGSTGSVGPTTNAIGTGTTLNYDYYLIFDVLASSMNLLGVNVYPASAGNVTLYIANSSGTILTTITYAVATANVKTYIPINYTLAAGTAYRIGYSTTLGGVSLYRNDAGASYPYTLPGVVSITGNSFSGYPTYYYYCYDWQVSTGCTSSRTPVLATVNPYPTITPAASIIACTGSPTYNLAYTATTGSPDQYSIDYDVNAEAAGFTDVPLTSFSSSPISLNLPAGIATGTYNATITAKNSVTGCTGTTATPFTVNVTVFPNITIHPSTTPQTVCQYTTATYLSVSAYNATAYQWYSNAAPTNVGGTLLSGATSSSYLPSASNAGTLYYYCVVSNTSSCSVSSEVSGAVNVSASPTTPGTISSNSPQCNGSAILFTASSCAVGTCYWVSSTTGIETDNMTSLNPTYTTTTTAGTYHVWIRAFDGSCWSLPSTASGLINPTSVGGVLTGGNTPICYGVSTGTLTLSAYTGNITRWEKQLNSGGWITISNTGTTYSEIPTSAGTWEYRAVVQSGVCPEAYSNSIVIVVNPLPDPVNVATAGTYCTNTTLTASGGNGGTIYWENTASNGISTATPSTSESVSASGTYYFRAQTSLGCWGTQGSAAVTINVLPSISTNPTAKIYCASGSTTFSTAATGTTPLSYQWQYFDGTSWANVANGTPIGAIYTNSTAATMTVAGVTVAGIYEYQCIVTNICGNAITNSASLTVNLNPIVGVSPTTALYCGGTPISLTANGANTYAWTPSTGLSATTGTTVNASPGSPITYTVTGTDGNGCTGTATTNITAGPSPSAVTINPATASICPGSIQALVASGGTIGSIGSGVVGTGSGTATTYDNPFYSLWSHSQQQILILASELTAAGIPAGNITSLSMTINSGTIIMPDFSLSIANTSLNTMSTLVTSGFTTVYTNSAGLTPVIGVNTITFSTPFVWNGTSNIILKYCWGNSGSTNTMSSTAVANTTSYVCAVNAHTTSATSGSIICSSTTTYLTYSNRPKYTFGYTSSVPTTITWSPDTDLYTNSGATSSYTGGAATNLWSKPSSDITYTATATSGIGCANSGTSTITINHVPAPTGNATQAHCIGSTLASLSVTGSAIKWYDASSGGNLLLSSATLVDGNTYYATQTSGGCESQTRFGVQVSLINTPAPTGDVAQSVCYISTVANLVANGSSIKWYDAVAGGNLLSSSTALIDGHTYYASETANGCESQGRLGVTATFSSPAAPTGNPTQVFLNAATVADLIALGVDVKWYDASTGGNLLLSTDLLVDGHNYYSSQTIAGCESQTRFETSVVIILIKTVNLHLFLQGLYDYNVGNSMVEAQDIDWGTGLTFAKYGSGIADRIQVLLYEGTPPFTSPLVNISGIDLHTDGLVSFQISPNFNGNYYIRVITRNHLEVWSANQVSFNTSNVNYDFTTAALQGYQAPGGIDPQVLLTNGKYGFYLGDLDQSLGVDFDDFNVFEPYLTDGTYGFCIADFNGGGLVDFDDFNLFEPVLNFGPFAQYPGMAKK